MLTVRVACALVALGTAAACGSSSGDAQQPRHGAGGARGGAGSGGRAGSTGMPSAGAGAQSLGSGGDSGQAETRGGTSSRAGNGGDGATGGRVPSAGGDGGTSAHAGAGPGGAGDAGAGGEAGSPEPVTRRLPLPCDAPFPTGFCFVSDANDWYGHGKSYEGSGPDSVAFSTTNWIRGGILLNLTDTGQSAWRAKFAADDPHQFLPGLYTPKQQGQLGVSSDASSCGELAVGQFSVEELELDPLLGVVGFSITFEEHCGGLLPSTAAMRGVINYHATGSLDASVLPDRSIDVEGRLQRVAYDASSDTAFGIDVDNQRLAKVPLAGGAPAYADLSDTPVDACVDAARGRVFVMNQGCSVVAEYRAEDLTPVRTIAWGGTAADPDWAAPNIYCAPDRLYLTDGGSPPALFTIEDLDGTTPTVHAHGTPGVGGLAFNATDTDLYYWYRDAWNGGWVDTSIHHRLAATFAEVDATDAHPPNIFRDPPTPTFFDETRSLVLAKNKILSAADLKTLVHEMPNAGTFGEVDDIYAFDQERGRVATMTHVYELDDYAHVAYRLLSYSIGSFFDRDGRLWSASPTFLVAQRVP